MKILITGASGLVGSRLCARLKRAGHEVVALSRDGERAAAKLGVTAFSWDYRNEPVPRAAIDGADSIVHLMGENVGDGRWTAARKTRSSPPAGGPAWPYCCCPFTPWSPS